VAKPRKLWGTLKKATRQRKLNYYRKHFDFDARTVARRYNNGTLPASSASRGHARTPEHGLEQALRKPTDYRKYLEKRVTPKGRTDFDKAIDFNETLDRAHRNFSRRLGMYIKYNPDTVLANVYGGVTSESGEVPGMSYAEAIWTASADAEEIRSRATEQFKGNPWWYH
jgi:hypothetical protein